jgi:beta-aspartyl-peptidase (threonine type)
MRHITLAVAVLAACARSPAPPVDPTSELRGLLEQSARAWNAGDLDGFLVTYAQDSATTFLTVRGLTHGYAAIHDRYASRFEPGAVRDSLRFTDIEMRMLGRDHVLNTARYVLMRGDSVTAEGPFTVIWERRPEGWRMIHDHSS